MLVENLKVAVVGGSLGGLAVANVLHQLGAHVEVFEAFPSSFAARGGALGGVDVALVQQIRGGRGRTKRPIRGHGHFYGDLWEYFYEGLDPNRVYFDADVTEVLDAATLKPALTLKSGEKRAYDLIIGADGGKSTIRKYVHNEEPVYAGYTVYRALMPTAHYAGAPSSGKTVDGISYQTLGFPVLGANDVELWNCGIYMAMPEADVEKPTKNRQVKKSMPKIPDWFVPWCKVMFDDFSAGFWETAAAKGKVTPHPVWELASSRVVNNRIALLGDAAHMASPRTGAGAYTAMGDAVSLGAALQQAPTLEAALKLYNDDTVRRGKDLYRSSRNAASYFARPLGQTPPHPRDVLAKLTRRR